ncbi:hypothetical protein ACFQZW_03590 [Lutibacter aestuarii]|uniref:Uncharacterized protein n=1 Tax=Lutibacter aestuarii TaxID=861111 RepID=A0ABW2Z8D3_9FLAO
MFDKPLSALDAEIRFKLQQYILAVHKENKLTTLLISHDISEIQIISDKTLELEHGNIIRKGTPNEVFNHKKLSAKFQFIGTIIEIKKQDFLFILTVRIEKDLVKMIVDESKASN